MEMRKEKSLISLGIVMIGLELLLLLIEKGLSLVNPEISTAVFLAFHYYCLGLAVSLLVSRIIKNKKPAIVYFTMLFILLIMGIFMSVYWSLAGMNAIFPVVLTIIIYASPNFVMAISVYILSLFWKNKSFNGALYLCLFFLSSLLFTSLYMIITASYIYNITPYSRYIYLFFRTDDLHFILAALTLGILIFIFSAVFIIYGVKQLNFRNGLLSMLLIKESTDQNSDNIKPEMERR